MQKKRRFRAFLAKDVSLQGEAFPALLLIMIISLTQLVKRPRADACLENLAAKILV
jgi:hypothetical protein